MEWNLIDKQQDFLSLLKSQGKSFNTIKNYKADLHCFNNFLIDKQQHLKIRSFTSTQVTEYSKFLDDKYGSPNSVRRRVQALRLFFDYLLGQNLFPDNPLKKMAVSPKVLDNPEPTPFPQVIKIYQLLKKRTEETEGLSQLVSLRNVVLFHLIYGAGLKVSDISILPFESVIKDQKNYRILVEHPKRDPYSIPLPEIFNQDFLKYKTAYQSYLRDQDMDFGDLFFNANPYKILSGGLSSRGIELFFEEIRKHLKTDITAKSLRQSCVFKWLNASIDHATIKEWLGVTPGYSLELYLEELKKDPVKLVFKDLEANG